MCMVGALWQLPMQAAGSTVKRPSSLVPPGGHAKRAAQVIEDGILVKHPAHHRIADVDNVAAHGPAVEIVVEGGQRLQLQGGHAEQVRGVVHGLVAQITVMVLLLLLSIIYITVIKAWLPYMLTDLRQMVNLVCGGMLEIMLHFMLHLMVVLNLF